MLLGGSDINNNSKIKERNGAMITVWSGEAFLLFMFKTCYFFVCFFFYKKNVNNVERANKENVTAPDNTNIRQKLE